MIFRPQGVAWNYFVGRQKGLAIFGSRSINLMFTNGCNRKLCNVWYSLDIKRNLILVGALIQCGCSIMIKNGIIKVIRGTMTIMKEHLRNGLYVLDGLATICCETKETINLKNYT